MDYFLDLVHRHYSFDEKYSGERRLIILGSSIPAEYFSLNDNMR